MVQLVDLVSMRCLIKDKVGLTFKIGKMFLVNKSIFNLNFNSENIFKCFEGVFFIIKVFYLEVRFFYQKNLDVQFLKVISNS